MWASVEGGGAGVSYAVYGDVTLAQHAAFISIGFPAREALNLAKRHADHRPRHVRGFEEYAPRAHVQYSRALLPPRHCCTSSASFYRRCTAI